MPVNAVEFSMFAASSRTQRSTVAAGVVLYPDLVSHLGPFCDVDALLCCWCWMRDGSQYVEVIGHLHDELSLQEFKSTDFGDSFGELRYRNAVCSSSDTRISAALLGGDCAVILCQGWLLG